jgi:thymidylate synthase
MIASNKIFKSDNFNDLFVDVSQYLIDKGKLTNPRGFNCYEIVSPQLILTNPGNALITIKERKLNYAYLIIEKFTYLSQISKPDAILDYNKNMVNFLNEETGDFDGSYGARIACNKQLDYCYNLLKKDKDSRQAVITLHDYRDKRESKDIPCTLSFQFLIREEKLNMIVTMRSNDIVWGTCLDIPAFIFLQEVLASWLNIEMGEYIHNAGSMHYYDYHNEMLPKIIEKKDELVFEKTPDWNLNREETKKALLEFWTNEALIRGKPSYKDYTTKYSVINYYLQRLQEYWIKKNKICITCGTKLKKNETRECNKCWNIERSDI